MDVNPRALLAWIGPALVYAAPVLGLLIAVWFPGRLARGEARLSQLVGLVALAAAIFSLGLGLSVLALPLDPLEPLATLGVGLLVFSVLVAIYGVRTLRTP